MSTEGAASTESAESTGGKTVQYQFTGASAECEGSLSVQLVVPSNAESLPCSDGKSYMGYRVLSGNGQFTDKGGQTRNFKVSAYTHGTQDNALWVAPTSGNGGNSYGIDSTGLTILGDAGYLASTPGKPTAFWYNHAGVNGPVTFQSVKGWPV